MNRLELHVALLPHLREPDGDVVIVVDALRATTSIAAAFGSGASAVIVCGSLRAAREAAASLSAAGGRPLLCGETRARRPKGFDFGNSPVELSRAVLRGRTLVFATTNGTRAFAGLRGARAAFAGALVNRAAALGAALAEARAASRLTVMCAGRERGARVALEDVAVAGAFVDLALGEGVAPTDEALVALDVWRATEGDALAAFRASAHGRRLEALGFGDDLVFAARADAIPVAPRLSQRHGLQVLTAE
ncbi:MAG TPA: 2-phosphosulfolactate phosphatase [Dehalococcoidia bacterium]|nr:2-phosphosulfolactate phosphatase [Dehalococcoidia bacterium]